MGHGPLGICSCQKLMLINFFRVVEELRVIKGTSDFS